MSKKHRGKYGNHYDEFRPKKSPLCNLQKGLLNKHTKLVLQFNESYGFSHYTIGITSYVIHTGGK